MAHPYLNKLRNRKWQEKKRRRKGGFQEEIYLHFFTLNSLLLLLLLLGVCKSAQKKLRSLSILIIFSREGEMGYKQCINLKGKHLFGVWSDLFVEFWIQWLPLRSSVWLCKSPQSTRKKKIGFYCEHLLPWIKI